MRNNMMHRRDVYDSGQRRATSLASLFLHSSDRDLSSADCGQEHAEAPGRIPRVVAISIELGAIRVRGTSEIPILLHVSMSFAHAPVTKGSWWLEENI